MATRFERPAGREAALIAGASIVGALALSTRPDDGDGPGAMLPVAQIICYTLILGAAVLHYFHWRVSSVEREGAIDVRLTAWLTVGLVLGASHGLVVRGELGERAGLRQRAEAVRELREAGVERLEPQQMFLFGGAGLHVVLLVGSGRR